MSPIIPRNIRIQYRKINTISQGQKTAAECTGSLLLAGSWWDPSRCCGWCGGPASSDLLRGRTVSRQFILLMGLQRPIGLLLSPHPFFITAAGYDRIFWGYILYSPLAGGMGISSKPLIWSKKYRYQYEYMH